MRPRDGMRCVARAWTCALALCLLNGCGGGTPREDTPVSHDETISASISEESTVAETPAQPSFQDGEDLGEPCQEHHYVVAAGTNASLEFQILMGREVLMLEAYAERRFDLEEISLKDGGDYWTEMGVTRGTPTLYLETIDTITDRWGVRAEELLQRHAESQGKLISISRTLKNRTQYKIRLTPEGFGLFEKLGKWWPEDKVADMSEGEVIEALGNVMEVEHIDQRFGTFRLPVEMIPVDSQSHILSITYDISFPASLPTRTTGTKLWQNVRIGTLTDSKFTLRFDYDDRRRLFHVYGPWFESSCF